MEDLKILWIIFIYIYNVKGSIQNINNMFMLITLPIVFIIFVNMPICPSNENNHPMKNNEYIPKNGDFCFQYFCNDNLIYIYWKLLL